MPDANPPQQRVVTQCPRCDAELNIVVDLRQAVQVFRLLTAPYRSFIERLHADQRVTEEEVRALEQEIRELGQLTGYGYDDLDTTDEPGPSADDETS